MVAKAPPTPAPPPPDPAVEAIKAQAEADKLDAIQQRTSQRTTDLMLRFGTRAAMSGMPGMGLLGVGMNKLGAG